MENVNKILHCLVEVSKPRYISRELDEYLCYVAETGDSVFPWRNVKCLIREKLLNVLTEFCKQGSPVEIPQYPNVEAFGFETKKSFILQRLESFAAAPFTIQRICELLTTPWKEYNRIDKFMRAFEKNVLVVGTREPGKN